VITSTSFDHGSTVKAFLLRAGAFQRLGGELPVDPLQVFGCVLGGWVVVELLAVVVQACFAVVDDF
jgi:hypothetical protein